MVLKSAEYGGTASMHSTMPVNRKTQSSGATLANAPAPQSASVGVTDVTHENIFLFVPNLIGAWRADQAILV